MADEPTPPAPDPTPNPNPDPAPDDGQRGKRGEIDKEFGVVLKRARAVAAAAQEPDIAPALAYVQMDPTLVPAVLTQADALERSIAKIHELRGSKGGTAGDEQAAHEALLTAILPIQTAVLRVPNGPTDAERSAYYIGANPPLSARGLIDTLIAARAILERLKPGANAAPPTDTLPGIYPDPEIKALADAIQSYDDKDKLQTRLAGEATKLLEKAKLDRQALHAKVRQIMLAADQAFPWRKKGIKAIRKKFDLPDGQPLG